MSPLNSSPKSPTLDSFVIARPKEIVMPDGTRSFIRPLSMAIEEEIDIALPTPPTPLIKDPDKGTNAPKIENPDDPAYKDKLLTNYHLRLLAKLAIAIDLTTGGRRYQDAVDKGDGRGWIKAAALSLHPVATEAWVVYANAKLKGISMPSLIAEAGPGNSSSPQATAGI